MRAGYRTVVNTRFKSILVVWLYSNTTSGNIQLDKEMTNRIPDFAGASRSEAQKFTMNFSAKWSINSEKKAGREREEDAGGTKPD